MDVEENRYTADEIYRNRVEVWSRFMKGATIIGAAIAVVLLLLAATVA